MVSSDINRTPKFVRTQDWINTHVEAVVSRSGSPSHPLVERHSAPQAQTSLPQPTGHFTEHSAYKGVTTWASFEGPSNPFGAIGSGRGAEIPYSTNSGAEKAFEEDFKELWPEGYAFIQSLCGAR